MEKQQVGNNRPIWLDPVQIVAFVDLLRESDYNIGLEQYLAVQELILALVALGEDLRPQRLKTLLGPVLCSSPQEQDDFGLQFQRWIDGLLPSNGGRDIPKPSPIRKLENELSQIERIFRSVKWVALVVGLLLLAWLVL